MAYRQKKEDGKLLEYAEFLARELEEMGQERTARAYRTVAKGLVMYNKNTDIPLQQISVGLIKNFEDHLKEKGRLPNTISYYMRNLRAIYNKAVANKKIRCSYKERPFADVYTGVDKTMKRVLTLEEIKRLNAIDFTALLRQEKIDSPAYMHIKSLNFAWRLFFFCFFARGMCFIDLAYLRKDNVKGGIIKYCQKRTGRQIEVKVTDQLQTIIDSFSNDVKGSPYLFPILKKEEKLQLQYDSALRLQNNRLHVLSKMAGIKKPVTTHVSQHSWATIGKQVNVPVRVLRECLEYSDNNTTSVYLGLLDNSLLDVANELITSAVIQPHSFFDTK